MLATAKIKTKQNGEGDSVKHGKSSKRLRGEKPELRKDIGADCIGGRRNANSRAPHGGWHLPADGPLRDSFW